MKIIILSISIFLAFDLIAQQQLGLGFAQVNFNDSTKLKFYNSPNSNEPIRTIKFFKDESRSSISIENLEKVQQWLEPRAIWLDFNTFTLRVITIQDDWIQVITNESKWKSLWVKNDETIRYVTWEQYLLGLFNIERKNSEKQHLYSDPNSNQRVEYKGADCFKVISIEGDWMEVTTPEYCDSFTYWTTQIESAWIKWRSNGELVVNCYETP